MHHHTTSWYKPMLFSSIHNIIKPCLMESRNLNLDVASMIMNVIGSQ